jgi:hypothetical protein
VLQRRSRSPDGRNPKLAANTAPDFHGPKVRT